MTLPIPPERDHPVSHPPTEVRGIGGVTRSVRGFPIVRPLIRAIPYEADGPGVPTEHLYVRRFWAAILGRAALEDLLRLSAAARQSRDIPLPTHLHVLIVEGLAVPWGEQAVQVPTRMPLLDDSLVRRLPRTMRVPHTAAVLQLEPASDAR